jgi:hypothetical protein
MNDKVRSTLDTRPDRQIDWMDFKCTFLIGSVYLGLTWTHFAKPEWQLGDLNSLAPFFILAGYIIARARRQPEKLDEWGITTRLTLPAVASALVLLGIGVGICIAVTGIARAGGPSLELSYLPRMAYYIVGAFPQQFVMCSVGLVSLAKLPLFRDNWRLPLAVGFAFCLAHFTLPGKSLSVVPQELVTLFPAGFLAACYFLKFRNILPLTALHAILYILLSSWSGLAMAHQ